MPKRTGVLLINLGTPDALTTAAVRRYLAQFLDDPRVIDMPAWSRWLLLHLIILRTRPKKSLEAYQSIWTDRGSPILFHTEDLTNLVQQRLGTDFVVRFAMRYQHPSIEDTIKIFMDEGINDLIIAPLYPHYASATVGSTLQEIYRCCAKPWLVPSLRVLPPFFDHPRYISAMAEVARRHINPSSTMTLFSFHGLPESHVTKDNQHCLSSQTCCHQIDQRNHSCYRAHCFATARSLALELKITDYRVCFQSRLGRQRWLEPSTESMLAELPDKNHRHITVFSPSFTADCLETIEELGIRGRETFMNAGGQQLDLIPCLNSEPAWAQALADMTQDLRGSFGGSFGESFGESSRVIR